MDGADGGVKQTGLYRENSSDSGFRALVEGPEGDNNFLFPGPIEHGDDDLFQEPLHNSKVAEVEFPLDNTPVAEVFSSSKASMSFNNSMTEGEFGVFEYEPDGGLRRNNNDLTDHAPSWAGEKNDELNGSLQGHERTRETPLTHEPVRPPSRHQHSSIEYSSFRQQQPGSNHDSGSNSIAYGSPTFLPVSEVSAEDVRQRQMSQQLQRQMQVPQQQHQQQPSQLHHLDQHGMAPQRQMQPQHDSMLTRPFDTPLDQPTMQPQSHMPQADYNMTSQQQSSGYGGSSSYPQEQPQQPQHHVSNAGFQDLHASSHSLGMNNTMHSTSGFPPSDMAQQQCNNLQQGNNGMQGSNQMYHQPCSNSPHSPANTSYYQHRQQGQSSISMPVMQGNVSIANNNNNNSDPKAMYSGMSSVTPPPPQMQGDVAAAMSEAMEKLSDSMKRTAMSRSMVKQFSGRNIVRHSSSRGLLSKQNSTRGMLASQRAVRPQTSERNLMSGDSARSSLRRTNSKHHLQHPNRMFLHDSQGSLGLSQSGHNSFSVQLDGSRNFGGF